MDSFDNIPPHVLVAGLIAGTITVVALVSIKRSLIYLVSLMLLIACTGTYEEFAGTVAKTFIHPIPSERSTIFAVLGSLIYAWILANWKHINVSATPSQMVVLVIMAYYASLIRFFHEGPVGGIFSIAFATVTLVPLALALPAFLQSREQIVMALRFIALAGAAYIVGVGIQFFINRGVMLRPPQSRLSGLSGNPQSVAISFSVFALVSLWLFLFDPMRRFRLFWAGVLGASLVILVWTGSRTGVGMTAVGMSFAFYRRFGRLILLAPVGLIIGLIGYNYLAGQGVEFVADRLVSTQNTREESWRIQWDRFTTSPAIGVGVEETKSENSYLYALAAFGAGMGLLVVLLVIVSAAVCIKLFMNRSRMPEEYRSICDLTLAYNALYFAGGVLEGYIMARVGSHLIFMSIFAAIAATLLRLARHQPALAAEPEPVGLSEYTEHYGEYSDYGDQPGAISPA
jgi:hypothetical protein